MDLKDLPDIFIDIGYIPAILLFRKNDFPLYIKANGFIWQLNTNSVVPFYEHRGADLNKPIDNHKHYVYTFIARR